MFPLFPSFSTRRSWLAATLTMLRSANSSRAWEFQTISISRASGQRAWSRVERCKAEPVIGSMLRRNAPRCSERHARGKGEESPHRGWHLVRHSPVCRKGLGGDLRSPEIAPDRPAVGFWLKAVRIVPKGGPRRRRVGHNEIRAPTCARDRSKSQMRNLSSAQWVRGKPAGASRVARNCGDTSDITRSARLRAHARPQ